MSKIIKLNYTKKVRYIFDKETEENDQLGEKITDHFGSFIDNIWEMSDVKRFHKILRECGLSVEEFLAKDWISSTPKKKVAVKKPPVKKPPVKKKVVTEKPPAKKKVVRKKIAAKKTPGKKRVVKKK